METADPYANAIPVGSVPEEAEIVHSRPCPCGGRMIIRGQELIEDDEGGRFFDRLHAACIECGEPQEYLFDISSFFGKRVQMEMGGEGAADIALDAPPDAAEEPRSKLEGFGDFLLMMAVLCGLGGILSLVTKEATLLALLWAVALFLGFLAWVCWRIGARGRKREGNGPTVAKVR